MHTRSWRRVVAGLAVVGLLAAGCADDADQAEPDLPDTPEPTDVTERPDVSTIVATDPEDEPPDALVRQDVVEGDGDEANPGTVVTVQYVGLSWSTGEEFDASWDRQQPFSFEIGAGQVIAGWEQGVVGMRVGGRRVLTIPPELAYGDRGVAGAIEPGETLVFVIDLLDVEPVG